jgi:hypothetical protein
MTERDEAGSAWAFRASRLTGFRLTARFSADDGRMPIDPGRREICL